MSLYIKAQVSFILYYFYIFVLMKSANNSAVDYNIYRDVFIKENENFV